MCWDCCGCHIAITLLGSLWIGRPGWQVLFSRRGTEGYAPLWGESHSSASTASSTPGFCSGGHSRWSNLRSNNAGLVCVTEENWTSSTLSSVCSGIPGSLPNQSTCGSAGGVWPCPLTHVVGGAPGLEGPGPSVNDCLVPVWLEHESALLCSQKVRFVPSACWILPKLPFVSSSVHYLHRQNF